MAPCTTSVIPGPHAHGYYRYEDDAGQWKTVDITRQNPSWISTGGDMLSITKDLQTFISALMGGKLLPAPLLAEMRKANPPYGYGMGLFVQDGTTPPIFPPPSCGVAMVTHNGGVQGFATMMYSTLDGSKTFTASLTYVDDVALSKQAPFIEAVRRLVNEVFCSAQNPAV